MMSSHFLDGSIGAQFMGGLPQLTTTSGFDKLMYMITDSILFFHLLGGHASQEYAGKQVSCSIFRSL